MPTEMERFLALVDKDGPVNAHTGTRCWLWIGAIKNGGYGAFRSRGRTVRAHRFAWEMLVGAIPAGYVIDHDEPGKGCGQPACVNPGHLSAVPKIINDGRRRAARSDSSTGIVGVRWDCFTGRYRVIAHRQGIRHDAGRFSSLVEASDASSALRADLDAGRCSCLRCSKKKNQEGENN